MADKKRLKIRFEIDTNPPCSIHTESKLMLHPTECYIRLAALEELYAGKFHAVLCRKWKQRIKGRDWYDLIWFVKQGAKLNLNHLHARLVQSGHMAQTDSWNKKICIDMLKTRIEHLDVELAKKDIEPFITDPSRCAIWSQSFFMDIADRIECKGV